MSTASGSLIATATVARQDLVAPLLKGKGTTNEDELAGNRYYVMGFGVLVIVVAILISDVVAALTIAYDVLVGGLLIPIIGGLFWRRATAQGALVSIVLGTVGTLGTMIYVGDIFANEPIYVGLGLAIVSFVVVSMLTPATPEERMLEWRRRQRGEIREPSPTE